MANDAAKQQHQMIGVNDNKCKEWGGNFLINIGPKADGSIPKEAYECLDDFEKISGKL